MVKIFTSVAMARGGCLNSIESGINLRSSLLDDLSVGYISCDSVKRNNNYNNKSVTVNK